MWMVRGVLAVLLVGCDTPLLHGTDAPAGDTGELAVTWSATPELPGPIASDIIVRSARFGLERLQVVGDAGPGDPRTTRTRFAIAWDATRPERITFPDAPPGLYSRITFDLGATEGSSSYEIRGETQINGSWKQFHVRDTAGVRISFACEAMLQATSDAVVGVRLRLDHVLDEVDFEIVEDRDGVLELDDADLQITDLRTRLSEAFELDTF